MAEKIEVEINVNSQEATRDIEKFGDAMEQSGDKVYNSIAGLKELKKQLKQTAAGSEEFKALYNQIDDLEDKIKSSKKTSADWIDTLESSGGPIGALGAGLNSLKVSTQSFGGALKATGIGLIIALVAGLTGAFSNNEGAMKKLQPLLDGVSKLFQGVFRAVEPLFNTLVDLAISALPMVSKAFNVVYSTMTAVLQSLGTLGKAIGQLMEGDFSKAWETAKTSVTGFSKHYDDANARFTSGAKELTQSQKDELEKRRAAEEKHQEELDKIKEKAKLKAEKEAEEKKALDAKNEQERKDFLGAIETAEAEQRAIKEKGIKAEQLTALDQGVADIQVAETKKTEIEKENSEAKINIAKAEKDAKLKAADETSKSLDTLANLLGKQTAAGKAAAVASTLISTFSSATKAYDSTVGIPIVGTVLAPINAGLAIASGLASVKSILSVKTPGGDGGAGMSIPNVPSIPRMSVSPNVVAPSGVNQLAGTLGNQPPIQAYVVAQNVTTAQSLERSKITQATI